MFYERDIIPNAETISLLKKVRRIASNGTKISSIIERYENDIDNSTAVTEDNYEKYENLIDIYGKQKDFKKLGILEQELSDKSLPMTFNMHLKFLKLYANNKNIAKVEEYFNKIQNHHPNIENKTIHLHIYLEMYANLKDANKVESILEEMKRFGFPHNNRDNAYLTYNALFKMYGHLNDVEKVAFQGRPHS